jgi:adenine C2-methylase RlmN of 23S rRNA A2503 and tRNA A37
VQKSINGKKLSEGTLNWTLLLQERMAISLNKANKMKYVKIMKDERGDVPGWVLVVLMTTGLVTAIWTIAAPRLSAILKNSLDAMNGIR